MKLEDQFVSDTIWISDNAIWSVDCSAGIILIDNRTNTSYFLHWSDKPEYFAEEIGSNLYKKAKGVPQKINALIPHFIQLARQHYRNIEYYINVHERDNVYTLKDFRNNPAIFDTENAAHNYACALNATREDREYYKVNRRLKTL